MGSLKPDATYIYERADGIVYAREFGSNDRIVIGWDAETQHDLEERKEELLWKDIRKAALGNEELQTALDRVKILYHLSRKDNGKE